MRELRIANAPGKEFIPKIIESNTFNDLNKFYNNRVDWNDYPLISERLYTYGIFDDLFKELPYDGMMNSKLIDHAIKIAENETDERFVNALFLLHEFCKRGNKVKPTADQVSGISALKKRVQKLSYESNLTSFWELIVYFTIKNPSIKKSDLMVGYDDYKVFIDSNFPSIDNNTEKSCPVDMSEILNAITDIEGEYEPLKFVRSAQIEKYKYWIWLYKNVNGMNPDWYISVQRDEFGFETIKRNSLSGEVTMTPEEFLLEYHYKLFIY